MSIPFFQVDAFIVDHQPLTGNPAAVMQFDAMPDDATMLAIAAENNLSETAFLVASSGDADYDLRWFTPAKEVDLCGHATIASGHVVIGDRKEVSFATRAGRLTVARAGEKLRLSLPASTGFSRHQDDRYLDALGVDAVDLFRMDSAEDALVALLPDEKAVRDCRPDFAALMDYDELLIVTAPGFATDIASRVFAPSFGIDEDPVTGAAHAAIGPFWAQRLGKDRFTALQASKRGGHLDVHVSDDRVILDGHCATVIEGRFSL